MDIEFELKPDVKSEQEEEMGKNNFASPITMMNNFFNHEYDKYSKLEKKQAFFIINRRCAIKFPVRAAEYGIMGIKEDEIVDFWRQIVVSIDKNTKNYNDKFKSWAFTKYSQVNKETINEDELKEFCRLYKISMKDIKYAVEHNPELVKEELQKIKIMKNGAQKIKIKKV